MFKSQLFNVVQKSLDGSAARHAALSSNIANANTPGYKRMNVNFQQALTDALDPEVNLKRTNPKHFSIVKSLDDPNFISIERDESSTMRNDGNNVDIDLEAAALAENNLYFNGLAQLLSMQLGLLRQSISEGRR